MLGRFVAFVHIAAIACRDQIGPDGLSAFGLRDDMVDSQVPLASAVLALAVIPFEEIGPVKQHSTERDLFVLIEPDHRRILKTSADGADLEQFVSGKDVGFFQKTKHNGFLHRHDCHRRNLQVRGAHTLEVLPQHHFAKPRLDLVCNVLLEKGDRFGNTYVVALKLSQNKILQHLLLDFDMKQKHCVLPNALSNYLFVLLLFRYN